MYALDRDSISFYLLLILPLILVTPEIIYMFLWSDNPFISHAALEVFCVFMCFMVFLLIWCLNKRTTIHFKFFGNLLLIIGILQILHIFNFNENKVWGGYLSLGFLLAAKILEAVAFLILSLDKPKVDLNLPAAAGMATLLTTILVNSLRKYQDRFLSFTINGYSSVKICVEILILIILLISFFYLKKKNEEALLPRNFIINSVGALFLITTCFVFQKNTLDYFHILGHILRICFYVFLLQGIFMNFISYPYEKLEAAERHMSAILDKLPLGLITFDKSNKLTYANKGAEDLTGYKLEEVKDLKINQIIELFSLERENILALVNSNNRLHNQLKRVPLKEGTINIVFDMYKQEDGEYFFIFDDAKKQQELNNLQVQTDTILSSINSGVIIFDANKQIVKVNQAFEKLVEISANDIAGMNVDAFDEMIRFSRKDIVESILKGDNCSVTEAFLITPQGNKKILLIQSATIYNLDSEIIGGIAITTDITDIKKQEEETKQKEKLALLGQMATGIVHEVRNPLTAIVGFNQLIKLKTSDNHIKQLSDHVESETNRLNGIVSNFLQFARPQAPVLKKENPNILLESMSLLIDTHLFSKGIKLKFSLQQDIPCIMADENQIKQVILNITKNAADALSETESPEVKISTGYDPLFQECYIKIFNNGKILTKDQIDRIGTPFYTTKAKGTGLGLSICNQIMWEHSGKINIRSQEGFGTEFELAFPCAALEESESKIGCV